MDLGARVPRQALGTMRNLLLYGDIVGRTVKTALPHDSGWLLSVVPAIVQTLEDIRNPAAHSEASVREVVERLRDRVMGVGEEGLIAQLARGKMRSG